MKRELSAAQRLIVAADFKPDPAKGQGRDWVYKQVMNLAQELHGMDVCIKVNSALRAWGQSMINVLQSSQLAIFADYKYLDIGATLELDGILLAEDAPEIVTVSCFAGVDAMKRIKAELPKQTQVLGVVVPTDIDEDTCKLLHGRTINEAFMHFGRLASLAGIDGLICSPREAPLLRGEFGDRFTLVTPAIRPVRLTVDGDDQNPARVMTPFKAIEAGADQIVVGRPILRVSDRRRAVREVIGEIQQALDTVRAAATTHAG